MAAGGQRRTGLCCRTTKELGVHPQAERFTEHEVWDFATTPPGALPVASALSVLRPVPQAGGQAGRPGAGYALAADAFTAEQKARNFTYYEALTVRDSSLSACSQAVMAAEVGHLDLAYDYLGEAALMDLDDLEHNTRDGLHIAALAGSWIALVRVRRDAVPAWPADQLCTAAAPGADPAHVHRHAARAPPARRGRAPSVTYIIDDDGPPLQISHHGTPVSVAPGQPETRGHPRAARPAAAVAAPGPGAGAPRPHRQAEPTRRVSPEVSAPVRPPGLLIVEHVRGVGGGLGAALHAEFGEEGGDVVFDGFFGEVGRSPIWRW